MDHSPVSSPRSLPPIPPVTPFRPRHSTKASSACSSGGGITLTHTLPSLPTLPVAVSGGLLGRPRDVRVTRRVGEDSLLVVWSPPQDDKDITGYAVGIITPFTVCHSQNKQDGKLIQWTCGKVVKTV